jgi:hypothetical protein
MALTFGFVIGMFSGAIFAPETAPDIISANDLLSLGFTILGGSGGFFATAIAMLAWFKWKSQQRNIKLYDTKVTILTQLHTLAIQTGNMAVMRANPSNREINSVRESLIETLSKLHVELTVYKTIAKKLSVKEPLDTNELAHLSEIGAGILGLNLWPEKDTIDFLYISGTTEWQYPRAKEFIDSLHYEPIGVGIKIIKISDIKAGIDTVLNSSTEKLCAQL